VSPPLVAYLRPEHRTPVLDGLLREHCRTFVPSAPDPATVAREAAGAVALVASSTGIGEPVGAALLDALPSLAVLVSRGSGADCFDVAAATERGIPVLHNVGVAADAVVEYVLGVLPLLRRGLIARAAALREGRPDDRALRPQLAGSTLGIVGFGAIGASVARRAEAAYRTRALVHHPRRTAAELWAAGVEPAASLPDLLARADAVVVAVPLTAETRGLLGAEALRHMRSDAVLVNVSRGGVVDEAALAAALRAGRLAGAALDVFAEEPPTAATELVGLPTVFATPHCAGTSADARRRLDEGTAAGVLAALAGRRPPRIANGVWPPARPLPVPVEEVVG
jgi:(S)-sulfolactate dehydrogenase